MTLFPYTTLFRSKLRGELVLPHFIRILDRPLYGTQLPWEALTEDDPWDYTWKDGIILLRKEIYVFTPLIQSGSKKRATRIAGAGTWGGKKVSHLIIDGENIIGNVRSFTFSTKDGVLEANQGRWRMHEYSIDKDDLVLCKIIVDQFNGTSKKRKYYYDQPTDDHAGHKRMCPSIDDDQVKIGQQEDSWMAEFMNSEIFGADVDWSKVIDFGDMMESVDGLRQTAPVDQSSELFNSVY